MLDLLEGPSQVGISHFIGKQTHKRAIETNSRLSRARDDCSAEVHVERQSFAVDQEQRGSLPLLRVRGELDIYTAPRLKEAVLAALGAENHSLAIDLSGVSFLDSTGAQVLMSARMRTAERGGELYIVGAGRLVLRLFHLMGLQEVLHLCEEADLPG